MQAPMPQGAPSPQQLAMFAQAASPQGGPPPMGPQGAPPGAPPQGMMPPGAMPPGGVPQGPPAQMPPGGPQGGPPPQLSPRMLPPGATPAGGPQGGQPGQNMTPQEMAAMGRAGDSLIAHLTPGEITIPKQIQSPELLAAIKAAFLKAGANPGQFVAGSPQASTNPNTGAEEFSFWSKLLPVGLGVAGAIAAPELLPALGVGGSSALLGAVGSGVGTTAGGLLSGEKPLQALAAGGAAGVGGYYGGQLFGGAPDAAPAAGVGPTNAAANAAANAGNPANPLGDSWTSAMNAVNNPASGTDTNLLGGAAGVAKAGLESAGNNAASNPGLLNLYGALGTNFNPGSVIGGAAGGMAGQAITAPPKASTAAGANANLNANFNTPYTPPTTDARTLLGQNNPALANPANFTNYNPATNSPMAFNFFQPQPAPAAGA